MNEVKHLRNYGTVSPNIISFVGETERVSHFRPFAYFTYYLI